jgi:glycosyltransferase involved in cell wall biosynthesis
MRILFAIDNLGRGGKERRMLELIKGLLQTGDYQITLVVFSDRIDFDYVYTLPVDLRILIRKPKKDPRVISRFFRICKEKKPGLIHAWGDMSTLIAIPSAFFLGIKLINGSVVNAPNKAGWFDLEYFRKRITIPFSAKIIGNTRAGLKVYDIPVNKAVCIYNGFDFRRLKNLKSPALVRQEFSIHSEKVIGMVGAFEKRKDYKTFLLSAQLVLNQGYDVTFMAIGEGAERKSDMKLVEPKYREKILFTGLQKDVESIIQIFDIGVLSTNALVHGEGISNAILEYMAQGKPVVATAGGGTPEILLEGKTGFLVAPQSVSQMAERIMFLLDNPRTACTMGKRGKEQVKLNFNISNSTPQYQELYQDVLIKSQEVSIGVLEHL